MNPSTVYRLCLMISAIDLALATFCAVRGDVHFAFFGALAFIMWAYGMVVHSQIDKGE